jgi:hypothetical protein
MDSSGFILFPVVLMLDTCIEVKYHFLILYLSLLQSSTTIFSKVVGCVIHEFLFCAIFTALYHSCRSYIESDRCNTSYILLQALYFLLEDLVQSSHQNQWSSGLDYAGHCADFDVWLLKVVYGAIRVCLCYLWRANMLERRNKAATKGTDATRCFASLLEDSVKIIYTFYIYFLYISLYSILIIEQSCNALYSFSLLNWREEYLLPTVGADFDF